MLNLDATLVRGAHNEPLRPSTSYGPDRLASFGIGFCSVGMAASAQYRH